MESTAILIADLGYGDAGKGSIVDYLTRTTQAHTVVRYNGGAQAAHNVVTPDGRHHTFAQFGSGTFVPGVKTHLSRFMLLHPLAMLAEERHLRTCGVSDAFERLTIEREALVITPYQQAANRLKEMRRGEARHGSCGLGIGETTSDWLTYGQEVLFAGDLADKDVLARKLKFLREAKIAQLEEILKNLSPTPQTQAESKILFDAQSIALTADVYHSLANKVKLVDREYLGRLLNCPGAAIFEGAQGVLLDEWWGFYPYNTWSTLTLRNAEMLLGECGYGGETLRLGLTRGYATRHGPGPFITEDSRLTAQMQDRHNRDNPWQRSFRVGYLDLLALQYAIQVTGKLDGLVMTNLDRMQAGSHWKICCAYRYPGDEPKLGEFFDFRDGLITGIKIPADPTDLARQEKLTRLLMEMQPVYTECTFEREGYPELISRLINIPLAITSRGPTANEKALCQFLPHGRNFPNFLMGKSPLAPAKPLPYSIALV